MSRKHVRALVAYRLEQAEEAIRSAETLLASGLHRDSVNRSYYAMFYTVLALLITKDLGTSKHQGVIATFDQEFVKKGVFPKDLSRRLHKAFERRLEADYGELVRVTTEDAGRVLGQAKEFVASIRSHLAQPLGEGD